MNTATAAPAVYYVTTREYVGLNTTDSHGAIIVREPVATISTQAPRTNMRGGVRTEGWLGATNDWSESAHGEFDTLEAARAYCEAQGWTEAVPCDDEIEWSETDVLEQWQSPAAAAEHVEAADWLYSARHELGITADSTDEELQVLTARLETEESAQRSDDYPFGIVMHRTEEYLRSLRDGLRDELQTAA